MAFDVGPVARLPGLSTACGVPGRQPGGLSGLVECAGANFWRSRRNALRSSGLAPGLRAPTGLAGLFTGDYAGELLYSTLIEFGLRFRRLRSPAG